MSERDTSKTWQAVRSQDDVEQLLKLFGRFHDSCVRELHVWSDWYVGENLSAGPTNQPGTTVRMLIQRQFRPLSAIELLFQNVIGLQLSPPPENYYSIIFEATLELEPDGTFCWADPHTGAGQDEWGTWIKARTLSWRDASEWMGEELRYGAPLGGPGETS